MLFLTLRIDDKKYNHKLHIVTNEVTSVSIGQKWRWRWRYEKALEDGNIPSMLCYVIQLSNYLM